LARFLVAGTSIVALGIALGVVAWDWLDHRSKPAIVIEDPRPDATIVVSVEGAVATPGVYSLKGDSRVQDAVDAAGGPAAGADLARINPAARLRDEERVVVPWSETVASTSPRSSATASASAIPTVDGSGSININTADAALLETLPGIGPVIADAIVAYREQNGPFRSVDELAEVKGISLKMVDEIRSLVTV
jgi:competence protein ComEA